MFDFYTLKNGVKVLLVPMVGVESIAVGVYVGTGSRYETPEINGISHFLEHMAFKGTKKYPTYKDVHKLEGMGAIMNAWTDVHATAYWCKIPADKWQEGLEVVKDLAMYPLIPEKELEMERGVILEEIKMYDDRPDSVVEETMQGMMYTGNPLGMRVPGTPEVIKRVSRDDFIKYHDSNYGSENMVVVMAGKLPKTKIDAWFEEWPEKKGPKLVSPEEAQNGGKVEMVLKKEIQQAHLVIGVPGMTMKDSRRYAMTLLTAILGQGMTSRLFEEVREKRGLCYNVGASAVRYEDTGYWEVYAGLNTDKLEKAIEAILIEMRKMKEITVGEVELAQAKEKIRGPLLFSAENPVNQMEFYVQQVLGRPEEVIDYDTLISRLMGVTKEEIRELAEDLFKIEKLNLAVVGPIEVSKKEELLNALQI